MRLTVYKWPAKNYPFVVDVQSDFLSGYETRIILPLTPMTHVKKESLPRLHPHVHFQGKDYVLLTANLAVVRMDELKRPVGSLAEYHHTITDALDFLFHGF